LDASSFFVAGTNLDVEAGYAFQIKPTSWSGYSSPALTTATIVANYDFGSGFLKSVKGNKFN